MKIRGNPLHPLNLCSIGKQLELLKPNMKPLLLLIGFILLTGCSPKKDIQETLKNKFDVLIISKDLSIQPVNIEENHLKEILILLHYNFADDKIKEHFSMTDDQYKSAINDLYGNGLIKKTPEDKFVPSCMVINLDDGNELKKTADSLGREMSLIGIDRLDKIKEAYSKIPAFKNIPFGDVSLFMIGNVVFNYFQMPFIEEQFLRAEAPRRGENLYYLALIENDSKNGAEPFGIFVNRFQNHGNYTAAYYGNGHAANDSIFTRTQINRLLKEQSPLFPFIGKSDQKKLKDLAAIITPDIISYLERNRTLYVKLYLNSVYKDQTSFREWFVWYYQFIIAQTNRTLIEKSIIKFPAGTKSEFVLAR
ncbi:MAG: hypothetical protein CVV24_03665 [Ignavibacteriae bacterium HGW-Ignavibacteriae-3]|nr:MAG: hypothetical protein CVV24_03665 [Ignavibacteriae bacterium HGW-Ignavibacteriae-3]